MRTYIVRDPHSSWHYIVNAESDIEAVQFALARSGQLLSAYAVFDHDLNMTVVDVTPLSAPSNTQEEREKIQA